MASILLGPIGNLGHPWPEHQHEIVTRSQIGRHDVYAFAERYLAHGRYDIEPEYPLDAIVLFDAGWMTAEYLEFVRELAVKHDVPIIGLCCDWFSSWRQTVGTGLAGLHGSIPYLDGVVTDVCGEASLRQLPVFRSDHHLSYRPVIGLRSLLSYGRLPTLGAATETVLAVPERFPQAKRSYDVAYIGNAHPSLVALRPYFLEALHEIIDVECLNAYISSKTRRDAMERVLLDTKICFNLSLGTTFNMRVYEATAAGCCLLTDNYNVSNPLIKPFADFYSSRRELREHLMRLLNDDEERTWKSQKATRWAATQEPTGRWAEVLDASMRAVASLKPGWRERRTLKPVTTRSEVRSLST